MSGRPRRAAALAADAVTKELIKSTVPASKRAVRVVDPTVLILDSDTDGEASPQKRPRTSTDDSAVDIPSVCLDGGVRTEAGVAGMDDGSSTRLDAPEAATALAPPIEISSPILPSLASPSLAAVEPVSEIVTTLPVSVSSDAGVPNPDPVPPPQLAPVVATPASSRILPDASSPPLPRQPAPSTPSATTRTDPPRPPAEDAKPAPVMDSFFSMRKPKKASVSLFDDELMAPSASDRYMPNTSVALKRRHLGTSMPDLTLQDLGVESAPAAPPEETRTSVLSPMTARLLPAEPLRMPTISADAMRMPPLPPPGSRIPSMHDYGLPGTFESDRLMVGLPYEQPPPSMTVEEVEYVPDQDLLREASLSSTASFSSKSDKDTALITAQALHDPRPNAVQSWQDRFTLRMQLGTPMQMFFKKYSQLTGRPEADLIFRYRGARIFGKATAKSLRIEDQAVIQVSTADIDEAIKNHVAASTDSPAVAAYAQPSSLLKETPQVAFDPSTMSHLLEGADKKVNMTTVPVVQQPPIVQAAPPATQPQAEGDSISFNIKLRFEDGKELVVRVKPSTQLSKITDHVVRTQSASPSDVVLRFDGAIISSPTIQDAEIEEDDIIDVFVRKAPPPPVPSQVPARPAAAAPRAAAAAAPRVAAASAAASAAAARPPAAAVPPHLPASTGQSVSANSQLLALYLVGVTEMDQRHHQILANLITNHQNQLSSIVGTTKRRTKAQTQLIAFVREQQEQEMRQVREMLQEQKAEMARKFEEQLRQGQQQMQVQQHGQGLQPGQPQGPQQPQALQQPQPQVTQQQASSAAPVDDAVQFEIKLNFADGSSSVVRVRPSTQMVKVAEHIAKERNLTPANVQLLFDGEKLVNVTVGQAGIEEGDSIDVRIV